MRTVKVAFSNMWGKADQFPADYLTACFPCLRGHYEFILDREKPELAFYSAYGYVTARFEGATRLVYAGEAGDHFAQGAKIAPGECEPGFYHYAITCALEQESPDHFYMPQGFLHLNLYNEGIASLVREPSWEGASLLAGKKYFCDFTYSNANSRDRVEFFHKLSRYKRVESCGKVECNNPALMKAAYSRGGYLLKQRFQRECKFSIAMENSYFPGYSTEKITDPFVAGSVPIYRGDPRIAETFNPAAFINLDDYKSEEEAIEYIAAVDQDDGLYLRYLAAPPFVGNVIPERFSDAAQLGFWEKVLA